jgi:hypothetical protein
VAALEGKGTTMNKVAFFAFRNDPTCFIHVILNAFDMNAKDYAVRVIFEGEGTRLPQTLGSANHPLHGPYRKLLESGLVGGVCRACATRMEALEAARAQGLELLDEMSGHPAMSRYIDDGYRIITM